MAQRAAKEQPWIEAKARLDTLSHDRDRLNTRILALFARVSAATGATSLTGLESDALFVIPEASMQQARSELETELA
ncbi:hypothetical protein [Variovorax paradoxus]|uniref:hypothetical protein n=1 Tax=Variovorax paradoxus TaxID=34073 RepID=UPI003D6609A7